MLFDSTVSQRPFKRGFQKAESPVDEAQTAERRVSVVHARVVQRMCAHSPPRVLSNKGRGGAVLSFNLNKPDELVNGDFKGYF